jgi:hypothetical protein
MISERLVALDRIDDASSISADEGGDPTILSITSADSGKNVVNEIDPG